MRALVHACVCVCVCVCVIRTAGGPLPPNPEDPSMQQAVSSTPHELLALTQYGQGCSEGGLPAGRMRFGPSRGCVLLL